MDADFDVAVIGGGIHGASVAEEAAARGYRVALLEQVRPAHGTSSRSSKLIHGGLRYLETGQLKLVAECLREREILLKRAPQLVRLSPFLIPVYRHNRRRGWQIRLGLSLYSGLGGFARTSRFQQLPRSRWTDLDGLNDSGLTRVFRYYDAQTDDAALTRAVLRSALELGARAEFPARFIGAGREQGGWQIAYDQDGLRQSLRARALVNAAGPWVNSVLSRIETAPAPLDVAWVQGSHVLIDARLQQGVYYVEAEDRRAVFVMPWQERVLIGTTERVSSGDPEAAAATPGEIDYLLRTLARYFPALAGARPLDAFAGLRVLPREEGPPSSRRRETQLLVDDPRRPSLLAIYGGKLTAARATAEQVMERLAGSLPERMRVADTRELPLKPA